MANGLIHFYVRLHIHEFHDQNGGFGFIIQEIFIHIANLLRKEKVETTGLMSWKDRRSIRRHDYSARFKRHNTPTVGAIHVPALYDVFEQSC